MKCNQCNVTMTLLTMSDRHEQGYVYDCPQCECYTFSEITAELSCIANTEKERRMELRENYEV